MRYADAAMRSLDLTARQWLLLALIEKAFPAQQPTLNDVARIHGSSRQNVKQIALQLEARGYLHLISDPDDLRALRLQLSDKVAIFKQPHEVAHQQALLNQIFADFTQADLITLHGLMHRLLSNLTPNNE